MTTTAAASAVTSGRVPGQLPASPARRWWQRRAAWQPSAAQLAACRVLALEVAAARAYRIQDHAAIARKGTSIRNWLTGAGTEGVMAARYAAMMQILANMARAGDYLPEPAEIVEAAAGYALFLLG